MENQSIAELYTDERIKSAEPQVRGGNGAVNNVEWRMDNQMRIVKDDLKRDIKDVKDDLKDDIREVKQNIREVKSDLEKNISDVKNDLEKNISDVKNDLEKNISDVKNDLKDDISDLKGFITILVTIAGFIISGVTAVVVKFL